MSRVEGWQLAQRQGLPLELKVRLTEQRIQQWYDWYNGQVYVSFSGGRDSTVLLDIVRSLHSDIVAVFFDTGLEFPELRQFVRTVDNVVWVRPTIRFKQVLTKYGYPIVSKEQARYLHDYRHGSERLRLRRLYGTEKGNFKISNKWLYLATDAPFEISDHCCDVMKKYPAQRYERATGQKPMLGTMACDSRQRQQLYLNRGCNAFEAGRPISTPLAFWRHADILGYIEQQQLTCSTIYDLGYTHTGCMFCLFGYHHEKYPTRLDLLQRTHPKAYRHMMSYLGYDKILEWYPIKCQEEAR